MRRRRTKTQYTKLYDDPTALFGSCRVTLWPNGEPEIWIQSADGRRSLKLTASDGPAGLGVTISRHAFGGALTVTGNLHPDYEVFPPKGNASVDMAEVSVCQYRDDPTSQSFKDWYAGRAEYPAGMKE